MVTIVSLMAGYVLTSSTVAVTIDGIQTPVRTHRTTVGDLLAEMGLTPQEDDAISPPPSSLLHPGSAIQVERARRVTLQVDGLTLDMRTHAQTPAAILSQAGVVLQARDLVYLNEQRVDVNTSLQQRVAASVSNRSLMAFTRASDSAAGPRPESRVSVAERPAAVTISVQRAVPVSIIQDGAETSVMTPARSVGEALFAEGIYIYAADIVTPALNSGVSAGMPISIHRAKPVTVAADGRTFSTRTQADTVARLLAQEGIVPQDKDYSTPDLQAAVSAGMLVQLTRVREDTVTEAEAIAFTTVRQLDGNLELDQSRVVTPGRQGTRKRTTRIVYENGKEARRFLEREWVDEEPTTQVIAYGTHVVVRTLMTPDGPIEYWRALRVWATYYTPASSGKARDHPQYGITRTGIVATKGVVAVDPDVIRLHEHMYVPGYGFAAAEDTGGLILGMNIDLAFDDNDQSRKHIGWTTIYLLTPIPGDIPWVLPDYPKER